MMYTKESLKKLIKEVDKKISIEMQGRVSEPAMYDKYEKDIIQMYEKLSQDLLKKEMEDLK